MATPRILLSLTRRSSSPSHAPLFHLLHSSFHHPTSLSHPPPNLLSRFHSRSVDGDDSVSYSVPVPSDTINWSDRVTEITTGEDSILPIRALISVIDGFHNLTGIPWWITIASSAVALRIMLLPVVVLQLRKLKLIAELFPKLPPPLPPPLSGRRFIDQLSLFRKERRAIGCPSFLWFLTGFSIQVPCFLLFVTSIRRMSLDGHPGFDCGGAFWFQNLTETPTGVIGAGSIFPILIAALHYTNVQITFRKSSLGKDSGLLGLLAKYYKVYLDVLTLSLLVTAYCIPQGSLVFWVTNSSLSFIQNLSLQHPAIRSKLGLPDKDAPPAIAKSNESDASEITLLDSSKRQKKLAVKDLKPKELLGVAVLHMSRDQNDRAIPLLQLALNKDPEFVQAMIVMGQIHLHKKLFTEAVETFERAIFKLCSDGHPTEDEYVDLLIVASQGAGLASMQQGKIGEGIAHLERIGNMQEPEEPKTKAHYFDGLILLSSALLNAGRKDEAKKYVLLAAAYNPEYNSLLEYCENDVDFADDLVNSRRKDY